MLANDHFASVLLEAAKRQGSLLNVANSLGVQPTQVYQWIAGVNQPDSEQQAQFAQRLLGVAVIRDR